MSVDEKPIKIKVEKVSKIFGKQTKKAAQMLANGKTKKEILKATGSTVGVNQQILMCMMVRYLSSWVYQGAVNQH